NVLSNSTEDLYNKHNGVTIPGRLNQFEEVEINNCNVGITYFNRGGQGVLKLDNCKIWHSLKGIDQFGGGIRINDCQISGYYNGIRVNGASAISKLRKSNFNIEIPAGFRSGTKSISYQGTSNLYAWKNWIYKGFEGVHVVDAGARLKCNTLNQNYTDFKWTRSSYISLFEGYNQFAQHSINHMYGRGDTYFTLLDGYNIIENSATTDPNLFLDAIISPKSPQMLPTVIDGSNNGYVGISPIPYPGPMENYRLQFWDLPNPPS